jgi:nucleotide-binding universal stress UspA family protein
MTTVLLAIDDSQDSRRAAAVAAACFGPDATYLAIYVDDRRPMSTGMMWGAGVGWGGVYAYPELYSHLAHRSREVDGATGPADAFDAAQEHAEELAASVGVVAEPLGDVGDPATAIVNAARAHGADVIAVGTHDRGWFEKLLSPSTTKELMQGSDIPLFVVPSQHSES